MKRVQLQRLTNENIKILYVASLDSILYKRMNSKDADRTAQINGSGRVKSKLAHYMLGIFHAFVDAS